MTKNNKNETNGRLTEADLLARGYHHIVRGTLRFDTNLNKQVIKIRTFGADGRYDGKTRWIATSDLHQCAWTDKGKDDIAKTMRRQILVTIREKSEV